MKLKEVSNCYPHNDPSSSQNFNLKSTLICSYFPIGKAKKKTNLEYEVNLQEK